MMLGEMFLEVMDLLTEQMSSLRVSTFLLKYVVNFVRDTGNIDDDGKGVHCESQFVKSNLLFLRKISLML